MYKDIVTQLNWVDFLVLILLFRTTYIAMKSGAFMEFFKLLGMIFTIYFVLHYYTRLSDFLHRFVKLEAISTVILDFVSLVILTLLVYFIYVIFREVFLKFIKVEIVSGVNKWAAVILGVTRGVMLVSFLMYVFSIPVVGYITNSIEDSYSSRHIFKVSPEIYSGIWNNFMSKFMTQEEFNKAVTEVQRNYQR